MSSISRVAAAIALLSLPGSVHAQIVLEHSFVVAQASEAVAIITARCDRCDWGATGREAAALVLSVDGTYSQHLLLVHGNAPAQYSVMIGSLTSGAHKLTIEWDSTRSARESGASSIGPIDIQLFGEDAPEHPWLSRAPFLHARPGTVERFSDVPLMMYAESSTSGDGYDYTVIFSHEDGGTPTDRLMATWGRTTDIEFVYGFRRESTNGGAREEYQGLDHEILPFRGRRSGSHPLLWVSTVNNMVSDSGPADAVRFAPAPTFVKLEGVSREAVMDANPWLYAVTSAELSREGLVDPAAKAGSGTIVDPRRFAVIEACGELQDATLAFDLAVEEPGGAIVWHSSDRDDPRFRIARSGCFRGAVPLPPRAPISSIKAIRARAYTRPPRKGESPLPTGAGRATLRSVNSVFMLDENFKPTASALRWRGTVELKPEAPPVEIPAGSR